uniref:Uncharacterized protein n=1 Tax=Panagrolaimus sp. JU765 TaxID=591449 RepID=A0AC34QQD6_9BILA
MNNYYRRFTVKPRVDPNGNYQFGISYLQRRSLQIQRWLGRYPSRSLAMTDGGGGGGSGVTCTGFEPQSYLRDRCKKCFRLKSKHEESNNNNHSSSTVASTSSNGRPKRPVSVASAIGPPETTPPAGSVASVILAKKEKRRSWRDKTNPDEGPDNDVPDMSDTMSMASFKSANSKGLSSAKSAESINSTNDTKSMVTAVSGDSFGNENEDRAMTPTESEVTNDNLRAEIRLLQEEVSKLKEERRRLTQTPNLNGEDANVVEQLKQRLINAESLIQDYRDENTVLKCELREIQAPVNEEPIQEKLKVTESLCDELIVENENLKADIRDLQQEIEEMQDQYREEEIEEFRELQRELEQNAKNCRVLQFKLRKSERQREQAEAEKEHAARKLKELTNGAESIKIEVNREKELESELRIAKEVSVRLHNELESAEEKRCKLEDEVFYYKEKCRELQTQNKWREARNKAEQAAKRHSQELLEGVILPADEVQKELRDVLEREADLREQLRFTEDDLKRCRNKLNDVENENEELIQKLVKLTEGVSKINIKRAPMTRSASEGHGNLDTESEIDQLTAKCRELEKKNLALTKKMLGVEIGLAKQLEEKPGSGFVLNAELEKDLGRLMSTIHELEKKNLELSLQLKKQENPPGTLKVSSAPTSPVIGKEKMLQMELRTEQEKRKELETEVAEYKSLLAKSDNQKLIAMATKVELLQNQLALANDRCNAVHKKIVKEFKDDDASYADSLKQRCEKLEKHLAEVDARNLFNKTTPNTPTADEIEQCCVVLASVEAQTNRICKQMEKMDPTTQKERRRSITLENSAAIVAELASVQIELGNVKELLQNQKTTNPLKEKVEKRIEHVVNCEKCEKYEEKMKELEILKEEATFYKKKNKELTNQVLQTEDRWSREIEKQTHVLRSQIHNLNGKLGEVETNAEEQKHLLDFTTNQLEEKSKSLVEEKERCAKLQSQLESKQKELQQIEKEQHNLKEWEIKYKKLEKLFDQEKEKYDLDRTKIKTDTAILKKRTDEAVADLEKLRSSHQKREIMWNDERKRLQKEMEDLKKRMGENVDGITIPVLNLNATSSRNSEGEDLKLKQKLAALERKNEELETKIVDLRISREEMESEMMRNKIAFEREKETMLHRVRQDGKIKVAEIDLLQQKFASRMSIMEKTNKSLHSQLVQTRRERDHSREAVANYEKRVEQEQRMVQEQTKRLHETHSRVQVSEKRIQELEAEVHRLTVELSLSKDAHKADKKLWRIEKDHYNKSNTPSTESGDDRDRRITEDALKAAESVQKQYSEYQQLYSVEVSRLNSKIKELQSEMTHKQFETNKIVKELQEQIKVLEIDQRNLIQAKEMQANAREVLESDQQRLLQIVQQTELQKLTRKYRVAAIVDQLNGLPERTKMDNNGLIAVAIQQLNLIRDEECQNAFTSNDLNDFDSPSENFSASTFSHPEKPFSRHSRTVSLKAEC